MLSFCLIIVKSELNSSFEPDFSFFLKHWSQNKGLFVVGLNGTSQSFPHSEQVTFVISKSLRPELPLSDPLSLYFLA